MNLIPALGSRHFQCPHCGVASEQKWFDVNRVSKSANSILKDVFYSYRTQIYDHQQEAIAKFIEHAEHANNKQMPAFVPQRFSVATCQSCHEFTLWVDESMVYPRVSAIPGPNEDMSENVQALYMEAVSIVNESPRGAAALLRLALQLLLIQLGKSGKNINNDIKELVSDGLSVKIQQALDVLRVVGNNAVHPGQIDMADGKNIALKLFHILNFIAEEMISKPKELGLLYASVVPEDTQEHINARDGKQGQPPRA
ncbi:MAG: DUF4145 domain-containing protein [Pusillimonas sp.]|nr:MAG: DUF4145 domain-containing protein [Pusillimonas sp.]